MNKRKLIGTACLIVLFALVCGLLYLRLAKPEQSALLPRTPAEGESLYKPADYLCSTGNGSLLCQGISDNKTVKYRLPSSIARATAITASPDGSKYLVRIAPSPIVRDDGGKLLITDLRFATVYEITTPKESIFDSAAWADNGRTVAVVRRNAETSKSTLTLHDTATKQERPVGKEAEDSLRTYPSADGRLLFIEERGGDLPRLTASEVSGNASKQIDTSPLQQHLKSYATVNYDNSANTFYVSGSGVSSDKPKMVVAKVVANGDVLQLSVSKVIEDTYAYAPLFAASKGMFVSRQADGVPEYGFVDARGTYSSSPWKPTLPVSLGLAKLPQLTARPNSQVAADDYYFSLAEAPANLQTALKQTVTTPACPPGSISPYNAVGLIAQSGGQAVATYSACGNPTELHYYTVSGDTYSLAVTSYGVPSCTVKDRFQLNDTVAPSCQPL